MAEQINKLIVEWAKRMRLHAGLPKQFWVDVVSTTIYLIYKGPLVTLNGRLPEEVWTKKVVSLSHLRMFSCISYVHVDVD